MTENPKPDGDPDSSPGTTTPAPPPVEPPVVLNQDVEHTPGPDTRVSNSGVKVPDRR